MASAKPIFLTDDLVWFKGRTVKMVPSVDLDLFGEIADMVMQEVERALGRSVGTAVHGAGIAGAAAATGEDVPVTWIAVGGEAGDGRNCPDCLALHGKQMTLGEYLDRKYTTQCDGNCRCVYAPVDAVDDPAAIEAISTGELEDEWGGGAP